MRKPQYADKKGVGSVGTVGSDTVSALDRGLAILQCFSETEQRLGPSDLARLTGIPRPSVIRLAATLAAHRLLRFEPDGERFMLGAGVMSLAQVFLGGLDLRAAARAPMQQLAEATGGAVYLALRDGLEMVLVEACRASSSIIAARLDVGSRAPLPNSALGRAYLATVEPSTRKALVESLRLLGGQTWAKQRAGLERALEDHQRDGWCLSVGEFHPEINSVSVAMTSPRGEVMAFNCGGPAFNFTEARLRSEVGPALLAMVQALSKETGGAIHAPPVKPGPARAETRPVRAATTSVRAEPFDFAQNRPVEASVRIHKPRQSSKPVRAEPVEASSSTSADPSTSSGRTGKVALDPSTSSGRTEFRS